MGILDNIKKGVNKVTREIGLGGVFKTQPQQIIDLGRGETRSPGTAPKNVNQTQQSVNTSKTTSKLPGSSQSSQSVSRTGHGYVSQSKLNQNVQTQQVQTQQVQNQPSQNYDVAKDIQVKVNPQIALQQREQQLRQSEGLIGGFVAGAKKSYENIKTTLGFNQISSNVNKAIQGSNVKEFAQDVNKKLGITETTKNVQSGLTSIEEKVRNSISPRTPGEQQLVKDSVTLTKNAEQYSNQVNTFNQKVEDFNKKYDKITTQEQATNYEIEKVRLQSESNYLNNRLQGINAQRINIQNREKYLNIERESRPSQFADSILTGLVLYPVTTAKFGVSAVTSPIQTAKGTYEGIKQFPEQIATKPFSTLGEFVGNVAGAVIVGQIVGAIRGGTSTSELNAIKKAKNKALNLADDVTYETIGTSQQNVVRQALLKSGTFADDVQVQSFIKTAQVGKAVSSSGTRWILKGVRGNQEYVLTFKMTKSGLTQSPKLAVTDLSNKVTKVYRPAYESELRSGKVNGLNVQEINRFKQTGVYTSADKLLKQKSAMTNTGNLIKQSEKSTTIFKVGKGSTQIKSITDILSQKPSSFKLVKNIKPIATGRVQTLEVTQPTKELQINDKIFQQQTGMILEKGKISKLNLVDFDITKLKPSKKPIAPNYFAMEINQILDKINKNNQVQVVSAKTTTALSSETLGFNPSTATITKVTPSKLSIVAPSINLEKLESNLNIKLSPELMSLTKQTLKTNQKENQETKNKTIVRVAQASSLSRSLTDLTKQNQNLNQVQLQKQINNQINKLSQVNHLVNINPNRIRYPNPIKTFDFPGIFTPPYSSKKEKEKQKKLKKKLNKSYRFKPGYSSDLLHAFFQTKPVNVTKKQYEQLGKKVYTGLESRPVLNIVDFNVNKKKKVDFSGLDFGF